MEPTDQVPTGTRSAPLRRDAADGIVAGICVMLADRWRVDPLLVRVAALLLALSSGIGVVLYAAAWLMIPNQGSDRAPIDQMFPGVRRLGPKAGIAVLVVACLVAAALMGGLMPFGIGPALVVAAVWYFGWYRPGRDHREVPASLSPPSLGDRPFSQSTAFTEAAAAWQLRVQDYFRTQGLHPPAEPRRSLVSQRATGDPGYSRNAFLSLPDPIGLYSDSGDSVSPDQSSSSTDAADTTPDGMAPGDSSGEDRGNAVAPARTRRRTGRMHLIGWALTIAAVATIGVLDSSREVPFFAYPAAVLLAVGISLMIGAWLPRPRGLVAAGVLLALVVGITAAPVPDSMRATVAPASMAELRQPAQHEVGGLVTDLSAVRIDEDASYEAVVDVGTLTVVVPPETGIRVEWTVDAGEARVLGVHHERGADLHATTLSGGSDPAGPILTVRAHVGLGELEVRR